MKTSKTKRRNREPVAPDRAAPVKAATSDDGSWVRLPSGDQTLRGLSRSLLYRLCVTGAVRSVSVARPGTTRGARLVHLPSLDNYLAAMELLALIDAAIDDLNTGAFESAEGIADTLRTHPVTRDDAARLLGPGDETPKLLFVLSKTHPTRVERTTTRTAALWKISARQ